MNTTNSSIDRSEFQKKLMRASRDLLEMALHGWQFRDGILQTEILEVSQRLQSLSASITSATSSSGIKTEDSQSPAGKPGGSRRKSTLGEPSGKTGHNTDKSLGSE